MQDIGNFIVYAEVGKYPIRSFVHTGSHREGVRKMTQLLHKEGIFDAEVWATPVAANTNQPVY